MEQDDFMPDVGDLVTVFRSIPNAINRMGLVIKVEYGSQTPIFTIQFADGTVRTMGRLWIEKIKK